MKNKLTPAQEKRFKEAMTHSRFMSDSNQQEDILKQHLADELTAQRKAIAKEIEGIIGEDDGSYPTFNEDIIDERISRNELRKEQRQRLSEKLENYE